MAGQDSECLICCDQIRESHPIWVCEHCLTCMHASCASRWSQNRGEQGEWTCPCCRSPFLQTPEPRCYCGARRGQEASGHSCWGPCIRQRKFGCPHPCTSICHPGACPPCGEELPPLHCACGKKTITVQCGAPPLSMTQRLCGDVCGKPLPCSSTCKELCHPGPCERCRDIVPARCYCGKSLRDIRCGEGERDETHGHLGQFSCEQPCGKALRCGNHYCQNPCHPGECKPCATDIGMGRCPCGSTAVSDLISRPRSSCLDPLPVCGGMCNKPMACGHKCKRSCHLGECNSCMEPVERACRCGANVDVVPCSEISEYVVMSINGHETAVPGAVCERICGQLLSCGRHRCKTRCCPFRGSGLDGHACEYRCNKTLGCKKHKCSAPCHKGRCQPCLEASFDESTCSCGRTTAYPPIPCGAELPSCPFTCTKPARCGHVTPHPCHFGECSVRSACSVLVKRPCCGGHSAEVLVQCWVAEIGSDIVCPSLCEKQLPCGKHFCVRSCHAGPCVSDGQSCTVKCGKLRDCGHPCPAMCHEGDCVVPCDVLIEVTCPCGSLKEHRLCGDVALPCTGVCEVRRWRNAFPPFLLTFAAAFPRLVASIEERIESAISQQRLRSVDDPLHEERIVLYFANGLYGRIAENIGLLHCCDALPAVLLEDGRCKVEIFVGQFASVDDRLSDVLAVQPHLPTSLLREDEDVLLCDFIPAPDAPGDDECFRPEGEHPQVILASRTSAGRIIRSLEAQNFHSYLLAEVFPGEWAICLEDERDQAFCSMIVSAAHVTLQLCRDASSDLNNARSHKPCKDLMSSKLIEVRPAKQRQGRKSKSSSPPLATANAFALLSEVDL